MAQEARVRKFDELVATLDATTRRTAIFMVMVRRTVALRMPAWNADIENGISTEIFAIGTTPEHAGFAHRFILFSNS